MNELIEIYVESCPPWKQIAANGGEKQRQIERRALLEDKAREAFCKQPYQSSVSLSIKYNRNLGKADACNIIGGIADTLQNIIYANDRQIKKVSYSEESHVKDEYWVTIAD